MQPRKLNPLSCGAVHGSGTFKEMHSWGSFIFQTQTVRYWAHPLTSIGCSEHVVY